MISWKVLVSEPGFEGWGATDHLRGNRQSHNKRQIIQIWFIGDLFPRDLFPTPSMYSVFFHACKKQNRQTSTMKSVRKQTSKANIRVFLSVIGTSNKV